MAKTDVKNIFTFLDSSRTKDEIQEQSMTVQVTLDPQGLSRICMNPRMTHYFHESLDR